MQTPRGARLAGWTGLALHLPTLVWYAASGLLAPGWAVVGLLTVWVVVLVAGLRMMRTRPLLVLGAPIVDAVVWFGVMSVGELLLGWTP